MTAHFYMIFGSTSISLPKFIDIQCLFTFDTPANPADVNKDGMVDSADIVAVIKEMPDGDKKADVNGDKAIDSADIVAVIKAMK